MCYVTQDGQDKQGAELWHGIALQNRKCFDQKLCQSKDFFKVFGKMSAILHANSSTQFCTLLALPSLGNTTETEIMLSVSCHLRWPKQEGGRIMAQNSLSKSQMFSPKTLPLYIPFYRLFQSFVKMSAISNANTLPQFCPLLAMASLDNPTPI